jgi:hypothetical protein
MWFLKGHFFSPLFYSHGLWLCVAFCACKRNQAGKFSGFVGDKARKQKFSEIKKSREKPLDK